MMIVTAVVAELSVLRDSRGYFYIRRDDRVIGELQSNEALGFIAAYTFTDGQRQASARPTLEV